MHMCLQNVMIYATNIPNGEITAFANSIYIGSIYTDFDTSLKYTYFTFGVIKERKKAILPLLGSITHEHHLQ